jgi:hypothetical protein
MSNSILPEAGNLDIVNANVRADKFNATTNIGVSNSAPTKNFSVGDKFHVSTTDVDTVNITGNLVAQKLKIGNLLVSPTFDFASVSNVGNVTANVIQFANATTGFTTTANVEIGGNIMLTSNAQVKVGSNVLAEYTGPHGREPKEMPLKKYPEIAFDASKLDGNDTTNTYTQAGYTVSSSTQYNPSYAVHNTFNDVIQDIEIGAGGILWTSATSTYPSTGGMYVGTTYGIGTTYGEFIKLELPYKIKPKEVRIFPRTFQGGGAGNSQSPAQFKIFGSNDNFSSEIVELYHQDTDWVNNETWGVFDISHTTHFKHFGIVFTKTNGTNIVGVQEIEYYGYEEPAPPGDLSLDTTLKSTFNSVRSNNYVMYFDGEDPATGNVPKYLPSGSAKSITPNNVVFDATNNCWTLNGSTESNVTTGSLGFEGDVPHTVSTWINASNLDANATTQQIFSIGSGYDKAFLKVDDTQIAANTWHNVTYAYQGEGGSKVTYMDGRKVEEAQVEDTFGDYPPFPMTGFSHGGYVVSQSSITLNDNDAWKVFDDINDSTNDNYWNPHHTYTQHRYGGTNGIYIGINSFQANSDSNPVGGEWLKIQFPYKLKLNNLVVQGRHGYTGAPGSSQQNPIGFRIIGSNDDINWYILKTVTNQTGSQDPGTHNIIDTSHPAYKYYVFHVTHNAGSIAMSVGNLQFFGYKEGDLTRFPEPTRVLKYPHIIINEQAKRGYVVSQSSQQVPPSTTGSYQAFNIFDGNLVFDGGSGAAHSRGGAWITGGVYDSSGNPTGSGVASTNVTGQSPVATPGEWFQLELPHKVKLSSIRVMGNTENATRLADRSPVDAVLAGSNDGTTWTTVLTYTGASWTTLNEFKSFPANVDSTNAYKYFRFIITKNGGQSNAALQEFEYYGTEEDTGTPAIVGGPFAGKVANFRVYDQYLGDERIQEIYDAQKDEFGHKKSSMTLYKGRVGVGTTEPEGALTVIDEPHALEKFPARAVSGNDSYVEGQGTFHISSSIRGGSNQTDSIAWQPFGNSNCTLHPPRHERISEEVDFGAWHKIESPYAISLKKAEIGLFQEWLQIGSTLQSGANNHTMGRSVASNKDGTRVAISRVFFADTLSNQGLVQVFDWNGTNWVQVANNILGDAAQDRLGENDLELDDEGNTLIVGSKQDGSGSVGGQVDVYYLNGNNWSTKGSVFQGVNSTSEMGSGVSISADGNTIAFSEMGYDNPSPSVADSGRVRAFTWSGSAWVQKGSDIIGAANEKIGSTVNMTPDGNYIITSNHDVSSGNGKVWVYAWDGSAWQLRYSQTGTGADYLGYDTNISDDGNVIAIGEFTNDDLAADHGAVHIRRWNGSTYALDQTLFAKYFTQDAAGDYFGSGCKLSGDGTRLIAGSRYVPGTGNSSRGRLYTFEYNGSSWIRRGTIKDFAPAYGTEGAQGTTGSGADVGFQNTFAISRDGSVITVGAPGDDTYYSNGGSVKIFQMASNVKGIWGSNDDKNWTKITGDSKAARVNGEVEFTNIDNPNYYKYHAIVYDNFGRVDYVKLFGVRNQGSSTLHDGTLTLTNNLDVPRIGPPLDADDTPRRDRLVVEYNTSTNPVEDGAVRDTSGRGFDGVFYGGATYDVTNKALVFDGTDDYIEGKLNNSGDFDFTTSFWVRRDGDGSNGASAFFFLGNEVNGQGIGIDAYNNGALYLYMYGGHNILDSNGTSVYFPVGNWVHVVASRKLGTPTDGVTFKFYVNGQDVTSNFAFQNGAGNALTLPSNALYQLGYRTDGTNKIFHMNGKISNFKLYDTALTAQEVKTLYDMGRTGSVANPKTLQIASSLDVRGDIYGGCPVFFTAYAAGLGTVTGSSAGTVIVFNKTVVNKGGAYDTSNGRCTFPISGYYEVFFRGGTASTVDFHAKIYGNGNAPGSGGWPNNLPRLWDNGDMQYRNAGTIQFFYYFTAGEYIEVRLTNSSVLNANDYNSFSVKYLSN